MILDVHAELLSMSLQHTVSQEIELSFRHSADARLFLAHRELQLAHDLPQALQGHFGFAPSAQDHEVVGVGHEPRAEGFAQARTSSIPARTGACKYSPARVRWASPAECRAACPAPRSCVSFVLDRRFLPRDNPATS